MISRKRIHAILMNEDENDEISIRYNRAMVVIVRNLIGCYESGPCPLTPVP